MCQGFGRRGIGFRLFALASFGVAAVLVFPGVRAGAATGSGPVEVLSAGSLVDLMQQQLGPAFHTATGYTVNGVSGGSQELAAEIKGRTQQADVFISAAPSVDASLEGAANGSWVSWYANFATSPLQLGYNPHSRFARQLRSEPWWKVVTAKGFLLGWTDPATDPKGVLAVRAMQQAATSHHSAVLRSLSRSTATEFPEETLVGRLQAGQLDAGFFYSVEAKAAHLATVPLTGERLAASFTVTVLNGAPDHAGALAFVDFLLGRQGRAILKRNGLDVPGRVPVSGDKKSAPPSLQRMFSSG